MPLTSGGYDSPVRAGPARVEDEGRTSGTLGPLAQGQGSPPSAPLAERGTSCGKQANLPAWRREVEKMRLSMLTCPAGSIWSTSLRMLCCKKKKKALPAVRTFVRR